MVYIYCSDNANMKISSLVITFLMTMYFLSIELHDLSNYENIS